MAQVSETRTEAEQAPARRRRRRGLELGGLVIGIIAGVSVALGLLIPARDHPSGPVVVWTTTALCTNPLSFEKPMVGPAGPMNVSEKNQASCEEFSRMAETPSPPAQSAQVE